MTSFGSFSTSNSSKNPSEEPKNKLLNNPRKITNIYKEDPKYQNTSLQARTEIFTERDTIFDRYKLDSEDSKNINDSKFYQTIQRVDKHGNDVYLAEDHQSIDNIIFDSITGKYKIEKHKIPEKIKNHKK